MYDASLHVLNNPTRTTTRPSDEHYFGLLKVNPLSNVSGSVTVPVGAYSQAAMQAIVDEILAQVNIASA